MLPGQALLVDTREPVQSRVDSPVRLLRAVVDHRRLPLPLVHRPPMPMAVLTDSPMLQACLAAASTLLHSSQADGGAEDDAAVAHLVIGLHIGLLAESRRQGVLDADADLRQRRRALAAACIDDHLTDPDLAPAVIATALGVGIRTLHDAFTDVGAGETVAASIRRRRVEMVQLLLRDQATLPRPADLATRVGFGDAARLNRSFRAVTGRTVAEWFADEQRVSAR